MFAEPSPSGPLGLIINHNGCGFARTQGKRRGCCPSCPAELGTTPLQARKTPKGIVVAEGRGAQLCPRYPDPKKEGFNPRMTQRQDGCPQELLLHDAAREGKGVCSTLLNQAGSWERIPGQGTGSPAPQPRLPRLGNRSLPLAEIQPEYPAWLPPRSALKYL